MFCVGSNVELMLGLQIPLHLSAEHGHNSNVTILLQHDSDINIRDANEMTALNLAEKSGHVKCVALLKEAAGK